jgi:cold shock CspA family protein
MDGQFANARKLWDDAKEQNFSYDERIRRQFIPRDPADHVKRMRFNGVIEHAKPGLVLIQPQEGSLVISTQTMVGSTLLQRGHKVTFDLTFSAKGPFAEHLQLG